MPLTIVDANFNPAPTVQRAALTSNVGVLGGTEVQRRAISSVFGVPDSSSRIISTNQVFENGLITLTVVVSKAAKLIVWAREAITEALVLEPFITATETNIHVISFTVGQGSIAKGINVFQEVSNG